MNKLAVLRDVTGQAKYVYSQAITSQMCVNSPRIRVANLTYEEARPSSSFLRSQSLGLMVDTDARTEISMVYFVLDRRISFISKSTRTQARTNLSQKFSNINPPCVIRFCDLSEYIFDTLDTTRSA